MKSHRIARISEAIREVAANAVLFEIKDPRVKNVTVTRAEVSGDLQHAKVFVSIMGSDKEQALTMHGLRSAAGYVQTKVADRLTTRFVPHITFVLDEGVKKSLEIARVLAEEKARSGESTPNTEAEIDADDDDDDSSDDSPDQPEAADGSATTPD